MNSENLIPYSPLLYQFSKMKIFDSQNAEDKETGLQLIAGDASDRKFYRLLNDKKNQKAICMQFPKWTGGYGGDPISWIGMQNYLSSLHIPVPKILEIDESSACIWTEDLGDTFLGNILPNQKLDLNQLKCKNVIEKYKKSLDLLIQIQYPNQILDCPAHSRFFDFEKLFFEMNFFITHFLNGFLNLNYDEKNQKELFSDIKSLCEKLSTADKVLCHRDYHIRNIMIYKEDIYWIDFQDARMGAHTYDVASLLRDSYVDMTKETRDYLFKYYYEKLNEKRKISQLNSLSFSELKLEFLLMSIQRNIKAIGSFGYLATQKNKLNYLKYILPTLLMINQPEAYLHEEINLKIMLPYLYRLVEELCTGKLNKVLMDNLNVRG